MKRNRKKVTKGEQYRRQDDIGNITTTKDKRTRTKKST